jgi:hypothetical protein
MRLDSGPVRERASALQAAADELRRDADRLLARVFSVRWDGNRAAIERNWAQNTADTLRREANELDDICVRLCRHADWIDSERADLTRISCRIEEWASSNPAPGWGDGRPHAGLVPRWPLPLSPEWRVLERQLRMLGVPV